MTSAGKTLSVGLTAPLTAAGLAASKLAIDAEETASKFNTVLGPAADKFNKQITEMQRVIPATRQQLQNSIADMTALGKATGLSTSEAAELSAQMVQAASDLSSFNNIPMDEALEAIRSGLVGSSEPLRRFGVDVREAALQSTALEMGLVGAGEEMDASARAAAVLAAIQHDAADAMGDAARTADSTANTLKFLKRDVVELATQIGQQLVPIIRPMIQAISGWLEKLRELSPVQQKIIAIVGLAAAALGPLLIAFGALASAVGALLPVLGAIGVAIAGIGAPVAIAVGAAVALGAALVVLWQRSETFREIVTTAFRETVEVVQSVFDTLRATVGPVLQELVETVDAVFITPFREMWAVWGDEIMVVAEAVLSTLGNVFRTQFQVIAEIVKGVLTVISETIQLGLNLIQGDWSEAWENVKGIFRGVGDALVGIAQAMWDGIQREFGEHLDKIISDVRGLFERIAQTFRSMKDTAVTLVKSMWEEIKSVFSNAVGSVKQKMGQVSDTVTGAWRRIKDVVVGGSIVPEMWALIIQSFEQGIAETQARMEAGKERLIGIWQEIKTGVLGALDELTGGMASKIGGAFEALDGLLGGKIGDLVGKVGGALTGGFGGIFESLAGFMGGPWGAAIMGALDVLGIDVGAAVNKIVGTIGKGIKAIGEGLGGLLGIGGHSDLGTKERELFGQEVFSVGTTFTDSYQRADAKIKALSESWRQALSEIVVASQPIMQQLGEDWRAIAEAAQTFTEQGLGLDKFKEFMSQINASAPLADQMQKFIDALGKMPEAAADAGEKLGDELMRTNEGATEAFVETFDDTMNGGMGDTFDQMNRAIQSDFGPELIRTLEDLARDAGLRFLSQLSATVGSGTVTAPNVNLGSGGGTGGSGGSSGPPFVGRGPGPPVTVTLELNGTEFARVVSDEVGKQLLRQLGPLAT
jgi:phage-related protein